MIHIFAREGNGVVQSVRKQDMIEPWASVAKIDDTPIEKHPPHANERRIEHRFNLFDLCLESCAPLLNRSCVVQAKVFDVRRNESGFAHGTNNFVERGNVSTGEDVFQCPGITRQRSLFSNSVEQPYAVGLQERLCFFHKRRNESLPHMFKHANGHEFVEPAFEFPVIFEHDRNLL